MCVVFVLARQRGNYGIEKERWGMKKKGGGGRNLVNGKKRKRWSGEKYVGKD